MATSSCLHLVSTHALVAAVALVLPVTLVGCDADDADHHRDTRDTNDAGDGAGDTSDTAAPEVLATHGAWAPGPALATARIGHAAARLADDRVLVVGGSPSLCPIGADLVAPDDVLASAEVLELHGVVATVTPAAPLHEARRFAGIVLLASGDVLVAGGERGSAASAGLASAERYDPERDTWTPVADLAAPRRRVTLAAWGDGGALALAFDDAEPHAELFHPDGTWSPAPGPAHRYFAQPVSLLDGRVVLVGRDASAILAADGSALTPLAPMPELSDAPAAARLVDGGVLVLATAPTGDFTEAGPVRGPRAWRWDPPADRWDALGAVPVPGATYEALTGPDGAVFARSGWGTWFRFDGAWAALPPYAGPLQGTPVARSDGSFVIAGGSGDPTCAALADVLVWWPDRP